MKEARHDLGIASILKAEALGTPGKRTFRLFVEGERGSALVWLEKEQLSALALAIKKVLEEFPEDPLKKPPRDPARSVRVPSFDFKAVNLGLAYDEQRAVFALLAYDTEGAKADQATLLLLASRRAADTLADQAMEVVAAGRPTCMLCRQPMDPGGHMCVRSNGHKASLDDL